MQKPWLNMTVLRSHIVSIPYEKQFREVEWSNYKLGTMIPVVWYNNMQYIAKRYNAKFKLTQALRHEADGQYCYVSRKRGATHNQYIIYPHICLNQEEKLDERYWLKTFLHELSHHIQVIVQFNLGYGDRDVVKTWLDALRHERTAERLAYYFAKKYAPELEMHHSEFVSYRTAAEQEWLRNYYKESFE